ncbi:hypothetical protein MMB19_04480 [Ralstonia insidiosa]|nr:hypothetical protein MMB19_04480 [Ralstonia insidiosa]
MQNPGGMHGGLSDIVAIEHAGFAALPPEHSIEDGPWVLRMAGAWPNGPTPPTRAHRVRCSMRID